MALGYLILIAGILIIFNAIPETLEIGLTANT
jgi:hypothetical protein